MTDASISSLHVYEDIVNLHSIVSHGRESASPRQPNIYFCQLTAVAIYLFG